MFTVRDVRGLTTTYVPGRLRPAPEIASVEAPVGTEAISSDGDRGNRLPTAYVTSAIQRYASQATPERNPPRAADIMTSPVKSIRGTTSLEEIIRHFSENRFRHYPVVDQEGTILGILSDRLAFKEALTTSPRSGNDWRQTAAETIMISPVLTAAPHVPIREIARVLLEERIGCMPVTNDTGELIGIITRSDLLRAIVVFTALELHI